MPPISRRRFLKISLLSALGTTTAGVAGFAYAFEVEPVHVDVVQREVLLPRLHPTFDGYRLVQFSDIHMGTGMTQEQLNRIVDLVNAQQPDTIAITGDFVTGGNMSVLKPMLVEPLRRLTAKDLKVAVLGNHDHWTDATAVRQVLAESELTELNNAVITLRRDEAALHVTGVDDFWEAKARLEAVLEQLPEDGAAVLLAHEPDFADISAATGRFDLQISGHSHGGQVRLPFINKPLILPLHGEKYPLGQYQVGGMIQYTNRGVGTIYPAVRFNCRPEITVFTLRAAPTQG
ncbi:MAG: metallophosphoesterase [Anaerolineae bacterium]|nr:metallophosphoesterase [Anaerolineae bacterium]